MKRINRLMSLKNVLLLASLTLAGSPAMAQDWWKLSDQAFAEKYADQALSDDIGAQSEIAWMLFARLNQQVPLGNGKVSEWERWPSNEDTFSVGRARFTLATKLRQQPHFEDTKSSLLIPHFVNPPETAGEERTRNMISFDYIRGKGLTTKVGINKFIRSGAAVDLPIGAAEIKAYWAHGEKPGAYLFRDQQQGVTYSLLGLHIMAKFRPTPKDPFTSEDPSWFWTTFEFKDNPGLAHAQSLLTYKDKLSAGQATALLTQAGLGGSAFVNYRSNGSQIRYTDEKNPRQILMGNTKMEDFAGIPKRDPYLPPSQWKAWETSCHTCHGSTSAKISGAGVEFYPFKEIIVGKLTEANAPGLSEFTSMDFIWSITYNAK